MECFRTTTGASGTVLFLLALALLTVPALPSGLSAQEAETDSIPRYQLDELVVSVLRTPVRLGDAAYPISVSGQEDLQQGKTGLYLEEALQGLAGVQVQNRYNYAVGERITIRGFGSRAQFGARGIQVVVDGIPATLPDGQSTLDHVDIGSVGRVEALRGPASALYGNATGGVLLFETQAPAGTPLRQEFTGVGGSDGLLRLQSLTSGTAGSTGYVFSVDKLGYDGFRQTDDGSEYGAADRLHLNGRLEQELGGGELGLTVNYLDLDAENPGSLDLDLLSQSRSEINEFVYSSQRTGKEVQQGQLGVTWTGPVAGLVADAAVYGVTRDFRNPIPFNVIELDRKAGGVRLSLANTFDADVDGIRWQAGFEWDIQDDARQEFSNEEGASGELGLDQEETVQSVGFFGQANLAVSDRVDVVGGLRYDEFLFEVDDLFPTGPDDSGRRVLDSWSPTVGVQIDLTETAGFFGNYSTFYETPTTVELANRESGAGGFNPDLEPQEGWTLEGGVRGTVSERLAYELTVFTMDLENELVQYEVPSAPGVNFFRNAGSSSRQGLEAVVDARLTDVLSGHVNYSYTDATFDQYTVDGSDFSGNQVPGLASNQVEATLRFEPGPWYAEIGAEYTDEVPVNDANAVDGDRDAAFADAYTLLDFRLGAEQLEVGNVRVSPFAGIRNLTDELYVSSVTPNAFGGRFFEPGPGRTFYVGLSTSVGGF